jgi:hypothetical protein
MKLIMKFFSVLLGSYLILSTLFSNTLSERQFLTVRLQFCLLHFGPYIFKYFAPLNLIFTRLVIKVGYVFDTDVKILFRTECYTYIH